MNMTCAYTAATAKGSRRENQDNIRIDDTVRVETKRDAARKGRFSDGETHLFCVCDGIGGECDGAAAAATALDAVNLILLKSPPDAPLETLVRAAAQRAQEEVSLYYRSLRRLGGATICMAAIRGAEYAFLNIGDSPAFHYRAADASCTELSLRHNLETWKKNRGETVLPGDASILTAYLGNSRRRTEPAHVVTGRLAPGDALLLCSDGVTNAYNDLSLTGAIKRGASADEMVSYAAAQPGADNCSAIHLRFTEP